MKPCECRECRDSRRIAELEEDVRRRSKQYTDLSERNNSVMDAALRERTQACAKLCDAQRNPQHKEWANWMAANCAAAIRALLTK